MDHRIYGLGHGTHKGIIAGLLGYKPDNLNLDLLNREILNINKKSQIVLQLLTPHTF